MSPSSLLLKILIISAIKNISTSINVALHRNSYVTGSHLCKNIQSQSTVNPTAYDFYYIIK